MFFTAEDSVNPTILAAFQLDLVYRWQESFSLQQLLGTQGFLLLLSALRSISKCQAGISWVPSGTRRIKHQRDEGQGTYPGLHRATKQSWDGGDSGCSHHFSLDE